MDEKICQDPVVGPKIESTSQDQEAEAAVEKSSQDQEAEKEAEKSSQDQDAEPAAEKSSQDQNAEPAAEKSIAVKALSSIGVLGLKDLGAKWLKSKMEATANPLDVPWPGDPTVPENEGPLVLAPMELVPLNRHGRRKWTKIARVMKKQKPGWVVLVVGGSGIGKSAFIVNVAIAAGCGNAPVLYVSAELDDTEILARLIAVRSQGKDGRGVAHSELTMRDIDPEILRPVIEQMASDCPNLFVWAPRSNQKNAKCLRAAVKVLSEANDNKPVVLMLDYIQRFTEGEDLRVATKNLSGELRELSRVGGIDEDWPGAVVWAVSSAPRHAYHHLASCTHLRAAVEGGDVPATGKPSKNGLRPMIRQEPIPVVGLAKESGDLEYDSTHVLVMTSDKGSPSDPTAPRPALIVLAKNRFGVTGVFDFSFMPASGRFDQIPDEGADPFAGQPPSLGFSDDEMPF